MPRIPTFDYKFITIFRLLFCALTMVAFLMPWAYWQDIMPSPNGPSSSTVYSGCSFMLDIQMRYLTTIPLLLLISMALTPPRNMKCVIISTISHIITMSVFIAWYIHFRTFSSIPLAYGFFVFAILMIINITLGFVTARDSDVEWP